MSEQWKVGDKVRLTSGVLQPRVNGKRLRKLGGVTREQCNKLGRDGRCRLGGGL